LLEQMDIVEDAHKFPASISGGEQQRAAIARALANDPPILVADEPTGNLDSRTAESVFQLFESLVAEGKTILMVTHDSELASRVPRTVTLADGLIVSETTNR
jgi:putative ABC transport system ATP-binding protein